MTTGIFSVLLYLYRKIVIHNNPIITTLVFRMKRVKYLSTISRQIVTRMLHTYIFWIHTDAMITDARIKDAGRKTQEWRTHEDFFRKIFTSHFIARVRKGCWRVACERMLETEHKFHILTPLLWPSRCVFLVLLDAQPEVLGSTPSGLFRGPPRSGVAFPTTSGLYCLGVCWQLHRGFSGCPLGRVWPSLPHLVSTVWKSTGNCPGTQTQLS